MPSKTASRKLGSWAATARSPTLSAWQRLEERWNEIQVGRQGSYSVERLESLEHYCKTTSRTRVLLVCVCTPLPALSFVLLLECLPLQPPSEGWAANWMFWIRLGVMVFGITFVGISDLLLFIPNFDFSSRKRLIVALGCAVGYVGSCLLGTANDIVGFPIPFIWQFGGLLLGIFLPLMLILVLGPAPFASSSPFRPCLEKYCKLLFGFMTLAGVFPLFKVLYDLAPVEYRGGALIVLPIWKFAAKHFMMWSSREFEDFIPAVVSLTVDLFSALFVSVCISSAGPLYLSFLFIAVDLGEAALEFREVQANATTVLRNLRDQGDSSDSCRAKAEKMDNSSEKPDLLAKITAVTRNPTAFGVVSLKRTRLWACLSHTMSSDQAKQLKSLEASDLYGPRGLLYLRNVNGSRRKPRHRLWRTKGNASIVPDPDSVMTESKYKSRSSIKTESQYKKTKSGENSRRLVAQSLQLLFHCEYLAWVEYIECVVPLVFITYKLVLHQLPNAAYYPDTQDDWNTAALVNILVFAALEVGSLLLLHHSLQRRFAFSPPYQLAFALETQMYLVQACLFLEIVVLLPYELVHFGADFTFRFEWLRRNDNPS